MENQKLADCIAILCKNGFSPTLDDIRLIVQKYVTDNDLKTPFENDNKPGRRWMDRFLVKNNLSLKRSTLISKVRLDCTSNPFLIYDFYESLFAVINEHDLGPSQIWNMDETGFSLDPKKTMSVAPKGKKALKRTEGCQRENITVLAVCSAAGKVLDPLIVNQGAYFQQCWRADNALPNTFYGVSPKGWMTSTLMLDWFQEFLELVQERPLMLIFDGHLTHFSIEVIKKALDNQIILIKLPPHTTDLVQPLDVGMFGPLKKSWDKLLSNHIGFGGPKCAIRRPDFVNMLCSIWHDSMPGKNAIAGFKATGIFPTDPVKFPITRFDIRAYNKFLEWVKAGKPADRAAFLKDDDIVPDLAENIVPSTPITEDAAPTFEIADDAVPTCSTSTPDRNWTKEGVEIPPITAPPPAGFKWKYLLVLVPESEIEETHVVKKSFEESLLDIVKPPQQNKKLNRKRIGFDTTVVSDKTFLAELEKKKEEKRLLEEKQLARKAELEEKKRTKKPITKAKAAKKFRNDLLGMAEEASSSSDDEPEDEIVTGNINNDENIDRNDEDNQIESENESDGRFETPSDEFSALDYLSSIWRLLSPPTTEEELIGKYVGAIFMDKKSHPHLYVGAITRRFLMEEQGSAAALEINCLKPKHGTLNNILEGVPSHLPDDIDVFAVHNVISKPLKVIPKIGNKFDVPGYPDLVRTYVSLKQQDRQQIHNQFICKEMAD